MFAVPAIAQTEATASAATAADRVERMTTPMLTEQKLLMLGERLALGGPLSTTKTVTTASPGGSARPVATENGVLNGLP